HILHLTRFFVILADSVVVTPFDHVWFGAAIRRLDPMYEQAAAGLGARPSYVLFRVRLPLLLPSLSAAAGLCFALSMGELSATMMLYPPDWMPLPVLVFTATDRGSLFTGSALAVVLMATTLLVLLAVSRIRTRASYR
ncbi:ABC transporter permease subunit, partial [Streptomyces sp. NPDC059762]|uniref:ABC transporter permease subunit n=1 Tax=Streptomyces sp. NPDC059762 TaxID=3346938 RepID=UPI0036466C73